MQDVSEDTAAMDAIYKHDLEEQNKIIADKPWASKYMSSQTLLMKPALLQKDPYFCSCTHQNGFVVSDLLADCR